MMSDAKLDGQRDLGKPHSWLGEPPHRCCEVCKISVESPLAMKNCPGYPDEEEQLGGGLFYPLKPKQPLGVTIHVTLLNGTQRWYPVSPDDGWKIDSGDRVIIIGKGLGRIYIPLDNVDCFSPE